jgi:hypothetical protein
VKGVDPALRVKIIKDLEQNDEKIRVEKSEKYKPTETYIWIKEG